MKIEDVEVGGFYVAGGAYYPYFAKVLAVVPYAKLCLVQSVGSEFTCYATSSEKLTERVTENLEALEELCALTKAKAKAQGEPVTVHTDGLGIHPDFSDCALSTAQGRLEEVVAKWDHQRRPKRSG